MPNKYQAVVIGVSAGGLHTLIRILSDIPEKYDLPIIIVQHRSKEENDLLEHLLQRKCRITIKQADEKEKILGSMAYIAPPDYHLLVENDKTFSLTSDQPVKFSRPSIDVLFETAAEAYREGLVGIIMTGANEDGADGIKAIHSHRGLTIAQNPEEAQYPAMPLASIKTGAINLILTLKEIRQLLILITKKTKCENC